MPPALPTLTLILLTLIELTVSALPQDLQIGSLTLTATTSCTAPQSAAIARAFHDAIQIADVASDRLSLIGEPGLDREPALLEFLGPAAAAASYRRRVLGTLNPRDPCGDGGVGDWVRRAD